MSLIIHWCISGFSMHMTIFDSLIYIISKSTIPVEIIDFFKKNSQKWNIFYWILRYFMFCCFSLEMNFQAIFCRLAVMMVHQENVWHQWNVIVPKMTRGIPWPKCQLDVVAPVCSQITCSLFHNYIISWINLLVDSYHSRIPSFFLPKERIISFMWFSTVS